MFLKFRSFLIRQGKASNLLSHASRGWGLVTVKAEKCFIFRTGGENQALVTNTNKKQGLEERVQFDDENVFRKPAACGLRGDLIRLKVKKNKNKQFKQFKMF